MTVNISLLQEIYKDRKKFSEQVFKVASSDLVNMGISVVSYTLKDVHDDQVTTYLWTTEGNVWSNCGLNAGCWKADAKLLCWL